MHITGMVHININCSDYQRSKAFYEMLGFEVYWPVPETNTEDVANAVGMPEYQVEGALMALKGAAQPMVIDLRRLASLPQSLPAGTSADRAGECKHRRRF
jgi:catechol 2,3-dioxygenase-like lactoylglutathione lyase family enzyme